VDAKYIGLVDPAGGQPISADGAMGANAGAHGWQDIVPQKPIDEWIAGLVHQNISQMTAAVDAIRYTFDNQTSDGSWSDIPQGCEQDCDLTDTEFFYAYLGEGLSLTQDSSWFMTDPATATLRSELDALKPDVQRGLEWIFDRHGIGPSSANVNGRGLTNQGAGATLDAVLVGHWLGDPTLVNTGLSMLSNIETHEVEGGANAGTFPENTGFDASYQQLTLEFLWYLYYGYPGIQSSLLPHLVLGMQREEQQITATNQVNHSDSSRTGCPGGLKSTGGYKGGAPQDLIQDMVYEAAATSDSAVLAKAQEIQSYYRGAAQAGNDCYWDTQLGPSASQTFDLTCSFGNFTFLCPANAGATVTWQPAGAAVRAQFDTSSGGVLQQETASGGGSGIHIATTITACQETQKEGLSCPNYQVVLANQSSQPVTAQLTITP
jgi:hypothetical protein